MKKQIWIVLPVLLAAAGYSQPKPAVNAATIDQWMKELSNWGRWGKDDQRGTLNLITPAKRKQAAALVRDGVSVSLSRDVETAKAIDNPDPFEHQMTHTSANPIAGQYCLDKYCVSYHGWAHTHMDALCHMFYKGKMYNGYPEGEITKQGAGKLSVFHVKDGIFSRGILMDIPRLKGVPYLEPGTPIYPEDLDAWEKKAGIRVGSGDVVFIRTGRWAMRSAKGPWDVSAKSAGLHASSARWLKQRDIAMLGSDAASDVMPSQVQGVAQPVHQLILVAMGTPIFDNCDLEAVSAEAARRNRWEFLLTASPLAVKGGTGSPLNPVAVF
jgi:kynurenine formamidase